MVLIGLRIRRAIATTVIGGALGIAVSGCTPAKNAAKGTESLINSVGTSASDASITFAVRAGMINEPVVTSKQVHIYTDDGVVTLRGTQPTQEARERAEQIARGVGGVREVVNELQVEHPLAPGAVPPPPPAYAPPKTHPPATAEPQPTVPPVTPPPGAI